MEDATHSSIPQPEGTAARVAKADIARSVVLEVLVSAGVMVAQVALLEAPAEKVERVVTEGCSQEVREQAAVAATVDLDAVQVVKAERGVQAELVARRCSEPVVRVAMEEMVGVVRIPAVAVRVATAAKALPTAMTAIPAPMAPGNTAKVVLAIDDAKVGIAHSSSLREICCRADRAGAAEGDPAIRN